MAKQTKIEFSANLSNKLAFKVIKPIEKSNYRQRLVKKLT